MSPAHDRMFFDGRAIERRKSIRFPIAVEARLKLSDGDRAARTINISSGGALFCSLDKLLAGTPVEAHICWPAALGTCGLKLVMNGIVVWSRGELIAVRRDRYDFKTVAAKRCPTVI